MELAALGIHSIFTARVESDGMLDHPAPHAVQRGFAGAALPAVLIGGQGIVGVAFDPHPLHQLDRFALGGRVRCAQFAPPVSACAAVVSRSASGRHSGNTCSQPSRSAAVMVGYSFKNSGFNTSWANCSSGKRSRCRKLIGKRRFTGRLSSPRITENLRRRALRGNLKDGRKPITLEAVLVRSGTCRGLRLVLWL